MPDKALEFVPGAVTDAGEMFAADAEMRSRFDKVADLVEGFESPFGLELLTTVHWIASRERVTSDDDLTNLTYAWNERKRQFSPDQIGLARRVLEEKGCIESPAN